MKDIKNIWLLLVVISLYSCKKMIEVDLPKNQLTTDKVFIDSAAATAVVLNSYSVFERGFDSNFSTYVSLYIDELQYLGTSTSSNEFAISNLSPTNITNQNSWSYLYSIIYSCNDVIFQLQRTSVLSRTLSIKLTNEAKFLRALAYFHLVNLYGDTPLLLQTDVSVTASAPRTTQAIIYAQMIQDLTSAKDGLAASYIGIGKVRANKWAASALLARVFLYQKNWLLAERQAGEIIGTNLYTPLEPLANVFKANSKEAILQLWNQNGYTNTSSSTLPSSSTSLPQSIIASNLYDAFEAGDLRKANWIGTTFIITDGIGKNYNYVNKYKNRTVNTSSPEYLMAFRIAEQFLIRAEARAMLGNINGAVEDINILRERAGLKPLVNILNQQECLNAIIQERRVELFTENGQRFFDLKRINALNLVMQKYKSTWQNEVSGLWPIPQNEITYNQNLLQNKGY